MRLTASDILYIFFREEEDKCDQIQRKLQREISDLTFLKETLSRQHENLQSDLNAKRVEVDGLKSSVAQLTSAQAGMSAKLDATKVRQIRLINNFCIFINVRKKQMRKKCSNYNSKSTFFIGYVNNAIIKFLTYYIVCFTHAYCWTIYGHPP